MSAQKEPIGPTPEEQELEKRVDAYMDPQAVPVVRRPGLIDQTKSTLSAAPVIDIFNDPKTAPEVPGDLLKKIGVKDLDAKTPAPINAGQPNASSPAIKIPVTLHDEVPTTPQPVIEPEPPKPLVSSHEVVIDDAATDAAIDSIAKQDSDVLLNVTTANATDAAPAKETPHAPKKPTKKHGSFMRHRWVALVLIVLLIAATFAVPVSRYRLLGLVIKKPLLVTVLDSKTREPISNAQVTIEGQSVKTDALGKATIAAPVGPHSLQTTKQYYSSTSRPVFTGFRGQASYQVLLAATGRQVPVTVINKITGKPLAGAEIKVLKTSAKTDKNGKATLVLPATPLTNQATVSASGYNPAKVKLETTNKVVAGNTFSMTPSGKIYFLSNETGTIDVVKTNLDGTERQTVLKGTGKEDAGTTTLLSSHDWRYAVLKAQRSGAQPALYMIDSATDKAVQFDSGDANFTLIGWYGHSFMYDVVKNSVSTAQSGHEVIKSYDAERGQLNQLDQNQAEGQGSYVYQSFYNFYVAEDTLVYNVQWYSSGAADLSAKTNSIRGIQPNGQGKKDYKSFDAKGVSYIQAAFTDPRTIDYAVFDFLDNKTSYYSYQNQTVKSPADLTAASFNKTYPSYLISPSGKQVLWSELRDGKSTPFTGDSNADNPKQLPSLNGYRAYGWYSDSYVLLSKSGSELYLAPVSGNGAPFKVTDYFKPTQSSASYEYGAQ